MDFREQTKEEVNEKSALSRLGNLGENLRYYITDFFSLCFKTKIEYNEDIIEKVKPKERKLAEKITEFSERAKDTSSKQRALNNVFYATIFQVVLAWIFIDFSLGGVFDKKHFFFLMVIDSLVYVFLGFLASKRFNTAVKILFIWFVIDKTTPGIVRLLNDFSLHGVFYFLIFNGIVGYVYFKALRFVLKSKTTSGGSIGKLR